jgi:hypothetical protein
MPQYYDGLDDDGYPIVHEPKLRYVHGSEAESVGSEPPKQLGSLFLGVAERAFAAMRANEKADSPIESILGAAVMLCFQKGGKALALASEPAPTSARLLLIPQFKWLIYRSDWAIYNPKTTGALLIECDGKEFHSGPEQIAHDQKKDQAAHDLGFLTMRFTGSQIHRNADRCAKEIFGFVYGGKNGSHS